MGVNEKQHAHTTGKAQGDAAPNVELHIEELLLHGFSPRDRFAISDALEHELTRLIIKGGISGIATGTVARLEGGRFKVAQGMRPGAVGRQIAQTLYRGISPAKSERASRAA